MGALDRFIAWGGRMFSPGAWHRAAFQPILYFFLWSATLRLALSSDYPPIQFDEALGGQWVAEVWLVGSLVCPPLALASWWLIAKSRWRQASLVGLWVRLGADLGQFLALVAAHAASALTVSRLGATEGRVYSRYAVAACIVFVAAIVVRDVWALVATERLAQRIRRDDG